MCTQLTAFQDHVLFLRLLKCCSSKTSADPTQVMLAWGLLMQHSCWYNFACSLVVSCSQQHLQSYGPMAEGVLQQQQQQQQQQQDWDTAPQQLLQLLLQLPDHKSDLVARNCAALAAAAACLMAWVQQPVNSNRSAYLENIVLTSQHSVLSGAVCVIVDHFGEAAVLLECSNLYSTGRRVHIKACVLHRQHFF
jgi:hypothetical protein